MAAVVMKIVLCIERWLFFFGYFVVSFVFINEGVDVVFSDFDIVLADFMTLSDFAVLLLDELVKPQ